MDTSHLIYRKWQAIAAIDRTMQSLAARGVQIPPQPQRRDYIDLAHYELAKIEFTAKLLEAADLHIAGLQETYSGKRRK